MTDPVSVALNLKRALEAAQLGPARLEVTHPLPGDEHILNVSVVVPVARINVGPDGIESKDLPEDPRRSLDRAERAVAAAVAKAKGA